MHQDLDQAANNGILKLAMDLRLTRELEDEYSKGLLFESQVPEIITRGHAVNPTRLSFLEERAEFSDYLLLPTKFTFTTTVRIYSMVMAFVSKARRNRRMVGTLLREGDLTFSVFFSHLGTEIEVMNSVERGLEPEQTVNGLKILVSKPFFFLPSDYAASTIYH